ncbi:helix-turn-helix domain-containing protein [Nocardioides sp. GCM10027113]|uniref:helix-turn-helix domain-containing protein n=1 Tax=unclassified Nocardioides TaxID=2615069 RepID=UPI0036124BC5
MGAAEVHDIHDGQDEAGTIGTPAGEPLGLAPDVVEVRRNAGLAALVGALGSAVAIAYLARASATGAPLDWVLAGVMGVLGMVHLVALVDARTPLLVADAQGVRIRLGRSWRGLPWGALRRVEHRPRRGLLRDGRLVMVVHNPERLVEELDPRGRRQSRLARRLYGAPFAVPLALSTRVTGAGDDLSAALERLSGGTVPVVDPTPVPETTEASEADEPPAAAAEPAEDIVRVEPDEPETGDDDQREGSPRAWRDPRPALAHGLGVAVSLLRRRRREHVEPADAVEAADPAGPEADEPVEAASPTPSPLRMPVIAARVEMRVEATKAGDTEETEEPGGRHLRRPGSVDLVEDTQVWGERVRPIAKPGSAVEPLLIDEFAVEPAEDPVVGPELVAARTRLGLTVDQLAERTRIRPHVIESIEVDDFAPCGGDFYARGHLRTLARVLGIDVVPLLAAYDDRYADAPINARRVFEAELATGAHGSIRGTRGGPNWSVLVAAVMALVLVWSVARLVMDSPVELRGTAPVLNGSAGVDNAPKAGEPVPVELTAAGGGAHVVVRDGTGSVVFKGSLAFGETQTLQVSPPVRIQSSDGSLKVSIAGQDRGALGATGETAQNTFPVD